MSSTPARPPFPGMSESPSPVSLLPWLACLCLRSHPSVLWPRSRGGGPSGSPIHASCPLGSLPSLLPMSLQPLTLRPSDPFHHPLVPSCVSSDSVGRCRDECFLNSWIPSTSYLPYTLRNPTLGGSHSAFLLLPGQCREETNTVVRPSGFAELQARAAVGSWKCPDVVT